MRSKQGGTTRSFHKNSSSLRTRARRARGDEEFFVFTNMKKIKTTMQKEIIQGWWSDERPFVRSRLHIFFRI